MERVEAALLKAVSFALKGEQMKDDPCLDEKEWIALLRLAAEQEILPLVYESVMSCESFLKIDKTVRREYRDKAVALAARQCVQTNEFLTLMLRLQESGFCPTVLKGIVVRRLYPKPMLRPSVDEDLIVLPEEAKPVHDLLIGEGLTCDYTDARVDGSDDLSYHRIGSPTYIELHTAFFPKDSLAYGDCNAPFEGALERCAEITCEDVSLRTLEPTDHLLYLMLHAYKHFLHSGMGLRHVCDIGLFAANEHTDAARVRTVCDTLGLSRLFAAVFEVGRRYLGLAGYPAFCDVEADPEPLLNDMLSGGLYGTADIDRAHSSTITLEAVSSQKSGRERRGLLHTAFPPRKALEKDYPTLKKHPYMLPFVWARRLWVYLTDRKFGPVDPAKSIRIGNERIELMKKYGLLEKGRSND